jgi:hypothetical protein
MLGLLKLAGISLSAGSARIETAPIAALMRVPVHHP